MQTVRGVWFLVFAFAVYVSTAQAFSQHRTLHTAGHLLPLLPHVQVPRDQHSLPVLPHPPRRLPSHHARRQYKTPASTTCDVLHPLRQYKTVRVVSTGLCVACA